MLSNVSHVVYIVFSAVVSPLMIIVNVRTAHVFVGKLRLKSLSRVTMLNICCCDIFLCLVSNTFYMYNLLHPLYGWSTGSIPCKFFKTFTMMANIAQIYCLCILNMDRLRRLVAPLKAQWSLQHGYLFLVGAWMAAAALSVPRLALFDESVKTTSSDGFNDSATDIVSYIGCMPVGLSQSDYEILTIVLFVMVYCLPTSYILYTLIRAQIFTSNYNTTYLGRCTTFSRMNRQLSTTFNITGLLFMVIWTPFFIMALIDVRENIRGRKDLKHVNFTLRCTLLVLGSAKPVIYYICLEKFRNSFKCGARKPSSPAQENSIDISIQSQITISSSHVIAVIEDTRT